MANNKVIFGDTTIMDITDTTAEASDVAAGEVFYNKSGVRTLGTGDYMNKVANPTANDILVTDVNGQAIDSGVQITEKQDTLVSGTNIKTINGISLLGSGDIDIAFTAIYGTTTYTDLMTALNGDKAVIVKDIPYNGDNITVLVNSWIDNGSSIEIDSIATAQGDLCDVNITVTNTNVWNSAFVNRDPFMLLDFTQQINASIPSCNQDISNTSIAKISVDLDVIDPTGALGDAFAVASVAKYEVWNAASGGSRINCWPVCMFSENGQRRLSLRFMCAGTTNKTAYRISGAILLKHR